MLTSYWCFCFGQFFVLKFWPHLSAFIIASFYIIFPALLLKEEALQCPIFILSFSYLSESGGKKIEVLLSLRLWDHSRTAEQDRGEDGHRDVRPRSDPLNGPAPLALTRLAGPRIQIMPDGGPPAAPDDQA